MMPYHMPIVLPGPLPRHWQNEDNWVKGDMIYAVSFERLSFAVLGKDRSGKRLYYKSVITETEIRAVQRCILNGFGLAPLTKHMM